MKRDSFATYRSFYEAVKSLDYETIGKVYVAINEYALDHNEVECEGIIKTIFTLIKPQLEASFQKAISGSKGGKVSKSQSSEELEDKEERNISTLEANPKQNGSKAKANSKQNGSKMEANSKQTASNANANVNSNTSTTNITAILNRSKALFNNVTDDTTRPAGLVRVTCSNIVNNAIAITCYDKNNKAYVFNCTIDIVNKVITVAGCHITDAAKQYLINITAYKYMKVIDEFNAI